MWGKHFADKMAIRRVSQHSQCSACVKHKMLLKHLAGNKRAHAEQMKEYTSHLSRQYRDRVVYWQSRSESRLGLLPDGGGVLTLVVDSMDKSKYRYPRSAICSSKEFSNMVRPVLDMTAVIAHGHATHLFCSEGFIKKDSSWTVELLAHAIHKVAEGGRDLRGTTLVIQSDNCCRENKNNTVLRWLGGLVATNRFVCGVARFLQSGHSHEDIDQYFSSLTTEIERHRELHVPKCFQRMLKTFMAENPGLRSNEKDSYVHKVDQVRDWPLAHSSACLLRASYYLLLLGCCGSDRRMVQDTPLFTEIWLRTRNEDAPQPLTSGRPT